MPKCALTPQTPPTSSLINAEPLYSGAWKPPTRRSWRSNHSVKPPSPNLKRGVGFYWVFGGQLERTRIEPGLVIKAFSLCSSGIGGSCSSSCAGLIIVCFRHFHLSIGNHARGLLSHVLRLSSVARRPGLSFTSFSACRSWCLPFETDRPRDTTSALRRNHPDTVQGLGEALHTCRGFGLDLHALIKAHLTNQCPAMLLKLQEV